MYHYETYLKHCIRKPIKKTYYDKIVREGVSLDEILRRKINKTYFYENQYLVWCEHNGYISYDLSTYRNHEDSIYKIHHHTYDESSIDKSDILYIKSIKRKDIKRKSTMNQNMILFYKNYFKRKYGKN